MSLFAAAPLLAESDIVIEDTSGWTIGHIRDNGDVEDASGWTIGRIRDNGDVEDASGWTIGRVRDNGSVEDSSGWTIGRIRENGERGGRHPGWTIGSIGSGTIDKLVGRHGAQVFRTGRLYAPGGVRLLFQQGAEEVTGAYPTRLLPRRRCKGCDPFHPHP